MKKLRKLISQLLIAALIIMQFSNITGVTSVQAASVTELENLTLSGGTFDSGITINQNYSIQITFSLTNIGQYANLFSSKVFVLRNEAENGLFVRHGWYNERIYKPSAGESITVLQKKNVTYVNGSKVQTVTKQTINDTDTFKFGNYKGIIKNVCIWNEADTLVADFIPVLDGSGKACMYNKVKGQYHYYSGNCIGGKKVDKAETSETDEIENSIEVDHTESKQESSGTDATEKEQDTILDNSNAAESDINYAESLIISGGYFDSGMTINQDYSLEMTFALSTLGQYTNLYYTQGTNVYVLRNEASSGLYARHGWYNGKVYQPEADEEITILQKKNVTYVNEKQVKKATLQTLQSTSNLLFGNFKGTIKIFRIWNENGKLVGEYLPAQDRTGKACMYDTVSGKYVYHSGKCEAVIAEAGEEDNQSSDVIMDEITSSDTIASDSQSNPIDSVKDKDTQFKEMLLEMLVTGDTSAHDISDYGYEWKKVDELYHDVVENEGRVAYASCFNMYYGTTQANGIVKTITLKNIDSEYLTRYKSMETLVAKLVKQTEGMTDTEKVVFAHDYIISHCSYSTSGDLTYTAAGALINGKALCAGYARAMVLLMQEMGIESELITSKSLNHAWAKVKVNGSWYHADPTWDDPVNGQMSHEYLLRTDAEYASTCTRKHYGWSGTISTDTTYSNWAVHGITGVIYYDNGSWYYIQNGQKIVIDVNP